jgi:hypothetical protein
MVLERIEDEIPLLEKITKSSNLIEFDICLVIKTVLKALLYVH